MNRGYVACLEDYCSILLLSYSIFNGALRSPDLLPSYSMIALALPNTIILIITNNLSTPKSLNHFSTDTGMSKTRVLEAMQTDTRMVYVKKGGNQKSR